MSHTQIILADPAELYARLDAEVRRRESEGAEREELLTARQLAAILQVGETVVRLLARKGRIPSVRINQRVIRFNLKAVRQALDKEARRSTTDCEWPLEEPGDSAVDYDQRLDAVTRIDGLRERLFAKYGEMPDSTDLIREDRAH